MEFSKHSLLRLAERGIAQEEVQSIIEERVNVSIYPSPRDSSIDLYFGKINRKYLLVVLNKITKQVVTVRPMRKAEKAIYEEDIYEF